MAITPLKPFGTFSSMLVCNQSNQKNINIMEEINLRNEKHKTCIAIFEKTKNGLCFIFGKYYLAPHAEESICAFPSDIIEHVFTSVRDATDFVRFGATCHYLNDKFKTPRVLEILRPIATRSLFARIGSKIDQLELRKKELSGELLKKGEERRLALQAHRENPTEYSLNIFHIAAEAVIKIGDELDSLAPTTWEGALKTAHSGLIYDMRQAHDRVPVVIDSAMAIYQASIPAPFQ